MTSEPSLHRQAAPPPWRDVRVLRLLAQLLAGLLVVLVGWWLWSNLVANMRDTNLSFGFGFLSTTAGFEIGETLIPYRATESYGRAFLVGLANTLLVSLIGILLATILGIITGVARLSQNWLVNRLAAGYVEVMRNTPLLVQLVLIYAVLLQLPAVSEAISLPGSIFLSQRGLFVPRPDLQPGFGLWLGFIAAGIIFLVVAFKFAGRREAAGRPVRHARLFGLLLLIGLAVVGWLISGGPVALELPTRDRFNFVGGLTLSPELTALITGLVVYTAAFIGEVVRGGIQAVRRGQLEAAYSLGLTPMQTLRLVVFPQALRVIVPPLTSQYLNLAKNSSLAIAVGFGDLFSVSKTMANQTGQPVSVIVLVMATYLAISLITSLFMNIYNRRVQVLER
ncbi:MAG: ABC transporter permease subunit [Chloroflexota bacterium]